MRLYKNTPITVTDLYDAAYRARHEFGQDIFVAEIQFRESGEVSNFYCESLHGQYSTGRSDTSSALVHGKTARAATWTAYGYLIASLFAKYPDARIGTYRNRYNFVDTIYRAREAYYLRQSLGITNRPDSHGSNCDFLELLG